MIQYLIDEIMAERERQDEKWGGPDHDDNHKRDDWFEFMISHIDKATKYSGAGYIVREELVKISALAIAAIESYDRKNKDERW